jgi:hypothetical protein
VRSAYRVPRRVDAGVVPESDHPKICVEVPLTPVETLETVEVQALSPEVSAEVRHAANDSGLYRIVVTPKPGLERGNYSCKLAVMASLANGIVLPKNEIRVSLEVVGDIQASPEMLQLGLRRIGDVVLESVALQSLTGRSFEVLGVRVEGEGLTVDTNRSAESRQYAITQEVRRLGHVSGRVIFEVKELEGGRSEVILPVVYHGYAGD